MIWLLARRLLAAIAYEPLGEPLERAHAALKIAALLAFWAAAGLAGWPGALLLAGYPALLAALAPRRAALQAEASLYPAAFIGLAALILSPHEPLTRPWALRAAALAVKAYTAGLAAAATLSTTSPQRLAGLLAWSPRLHDAVTVAYRAIPLTLGDAADALAAQRLLGKKSHHAITAVVLASLRRAEGIATSLYARGAHSPRPRTPTEPPGDPILGALLLAAALATLAAVLAVPG